MKLYHVVKLSEANDNEDVRTTSSLGIKKRNKRGEKSDIFKKTDWDSPDIQRVLSKLTAAGIDIQQLVKDCQPSIINMEQSYKYAPKLYQAMYDNRVESAIFGVLMRKYPAEQLAEKIGAPIFNRTTMNRLLTKMLATGNEFFPLKSAVEERALGVPVLEYAEDYDTKDPRGPTKNTTACATPNGTFIFNENFMQTLLNYAHLVDLKPTASYLNETGRRAIPKEYGYIEMLLAHEFLHYTRSDFHKQHKISNYDGYIGNLATDMRSNYKLVESGYSQLPVGYFNNDFNGDNYYSFAELYNDVLEEYNKLPEQQQQEMQDYGQDNHVPGEEEASTKQEKQKADKKTSEQMDSHDQQSENKIAEDKQEDQDNTADKSTPSDQRSQDTNKSSDTGTERLVKDNDKRKPTISWQQIIDKFVKAGKPEEQTTWAKSRRSNVSMMPSLDTFGAAAMKPGIRKMEHDDTKLVICIDSSGSMSSRIANVLANTLNLIKRHYPTSVFYIIKVSGRTDLYRCNWSTNSAEQINTLTDTKGIMGKLDALLSKTLDGGTEFNSQTHGVFKSLLDKQYNLLIMTDTDIIQPHNITTIIQLAHNYSNYMNIILANNDDYNVFMNNVRLDLNNVTHF